MERLVEDFEQRSGHVVQVSLGATGALYAQIRHGAPYALMLSADQAIPARLLDEGLAVPGSRFTYARGRLALWSADPQRIDGSDRALREGAYTRLALANPRLAPYGAAAQQVLAHLQVQVGPGQLLVQGESISQTYQFVASGNAELGFVALSQVWRDGALLAGSAWIVPEALHAPLDQDVVLLTSGAEQPAARALLDYLRSAPAQRLIGAFGYQVLP